MWRVLRKRIFSCNVRTWVNIWQCDTSIFVYLKKWLSRKVYLLYRVSPFRMQDTYSICDIRQIVLHNHVIMGPIKHDNITTVDSLTIVMQLFMNLRLRHGELFFVWPYCHTGLSNQKTKLLGLFFTADYSLSFALHITKVKVRFARLQCIECVCIWSDHMSKSLFVAKWNAEIVRNEFCLFDSSHVFRLAETILDTEITWFLSRNVKVFWRFDPAMYGTRYYFEFSNTLARTTREWARGFASPS